MQLIPNTVSERKRINEMDPVELVEFARPLYEKFSNHVLDMQELKNLNLAKINFKQQTGRPLTEATLTRI